MCCASGSNLDRLLERARAGQNDALGQVLEVYHSYLTLLARLQIDRQFDGKFDASDVVQDTFLAVQQGFGGFRGSTQQELLAWLRKILASRIADQVRRFQEAKCRDVRLERQLDEALNRSSQMVHALASPKASPSDSASRRERAVLLADALGKLPADYREVMILHHLEELTLPEVAQRMGRSVGAVEKLWVRALASLRNLLEGQTDGFT